MFFQKFWPTVSSAIVSFVVAVLEGRRSAREVNGTLISLIPKIENPKRITEFRAISLCNVLFKIITKCLVLRLRSILPLIIAPTQSSFVLKRQIIDNIVVVQEVIYTMRKRKGRMRWMVMKIDLEKAYDIVDWRCLESTLEAARIPQSWVSCIMNCVSTASMRLLWNGEVTDEFQLSRGIRQGDPFSSYLFVLVMERLSHLINAAVEEGD